MMKYLILTCLVGSLVDLSRLAKQINDWVSIDCRCDRDAMVNQEPSSRACVRALEIPRSSSSIDNWERIYCVPILTFTVVPPIWKPPHVLLISRLRRFQMMHQYMRGFIGRVISLTRVLNKYMMECGLSFCHSLRQNIVLEWHKRTPHWGSWSFCASPENATPLRGVETISA